MVPTAALSMVHRWSKIKGILIILVYSSSNTKTIKRVESTYFCNTRLTLLFSSTTNKFEESVSRSFVAAP